MDNEIHAVPFLRDEVVAETKLGLAYQESRTFSCPRTILFLNGYGTRPGGIISTILRTHGHQVVEPDLPDDNFARSVSTSQRVFCRHQPEIVVGWSRGGAVALSLDSRNTPLILIAPAWRNWGTLATVKPNVAILHSPHDELIPIEDSRQLLLNSGLSLRQLRAVGEDHRMIDEGAFVALLETVDAIVGDCEGRQAA